MDDITQDKLREAKELLDRGDSVYVSRFIAGILRGYYRGKKEETRRVYVVRDGYYSYDDVHIELREKGQ